tara:strand:+ start:130 stop:474 length:345 start_codon:yes stop_codon:yes gene_type:complete
MIVELFVVSQALQKFMRGDSGFVSPFKRTTSPTSQRPACPTPASAQLDIPFDQVSIFKDLGLLIPTSAANGGDTVRSRPQPPVPLTSAEAALAYTGAATGVPEPMAVKIATGRL